MRFLPPGFLALALLAAPHVARADDLLDATRHARQLCASRAPQLRPRPQLDEAARRLSQGAKLDDALQASGYRSQRSYQWRLSGYANPQAVAQALVQGHCKTLGDAAMADVGTYRQGNQYWIVAAQPFDPPAAEQAGDVAGRVLALVNQARAQPRTCGNRAFNPAPPVALDAALGRAAAVHAQSMAQFGYLEHEGRDGSSPADRASRAGYRWRSIGENVAMGQTTPEKVVQDWLRSPEHCANIMEPRFTEMGVAFAVNTASEGGIYWAQSFGRR